jgi:hypothetical protein
VMIAKSGILVDDKLAVQFKDGKIINEDPGGAYLPLRLALEKRVEQIQYIADRGGTPFDGLLMVVSDGDIPYEVIGKVLDQAGRARFTSYRLVVRHK